MNDRGPDADTLDLLQLLRSADPRGEIERGEARFSEDERVAAREIIDEAAELVHRELAVVRSVVADWRLLVETRQERLAGAEEARVHRGLVLRLVVQGPSTRIPVLWQFGGLGDRIEALSHALPRLVLPEIEAALVGEALPAPTTCPAVLEPWLAAQLVHECIGHTAEADNHLRYGREVGLGPGHRWSTDRFQVWDDPTLEGHRGSFAFDDEGHPSQPALLVDNGVAGSLLSSEATHGALGAPCVRRARRVAHAERSLPRMSVTWMSAGEHRVEQLVSEVELGLYCVGTWGGGSVGARCLIRPTYALWIRDGVITKEIVRRLDLVGDKAQLIGAISGRGRDLELFDPVMGCDKDGQDGLPVTLGAPTLLLREARFVPVSP